VLTPEQEECRDTIVNLLTYVMENRIKGNLNLNFPGNGLVGGQVKFETYIPISRGKQLSVRNIDRMIYKKISR
jgi:hypothetical protein